jgi:hypothetical protein
MPSRFVEMSVVELLFSDVNSITIRVPTQL